MVKLAPEEQAVFLREHPRTFEPSAGAWGRQGCTNVKLATADKRAVRSAARLAWEGGDGRQTSEDPQAKAEVDWDPPQTTECSCRTASS